jgi:hypothetical protein
MAILMTIRPFKPAKWPEPAFFSLELRPGIREEFDHRMKRTNAPASKHDALARKRALIRSLIEQHGWASTPDVPLTAHKQSPVPAPSNVIPFPVLQK